MIPLKRPSFRLKLTIACLAFLVSIDSALAQQWTSYNPTAWFDINAIVLPEAGVVAIGGGQESNEAIQIMFRGDNYGLSWYENAHDGPNPWNRAIAFSDSIHGYAVGFDGRIIYSDDGGANWGYETYPIDRDFNKIINVAPTSWFIAGGNKTNDSIQTILKSSDNGVSWDVIHDAPGPWLKSIHFTDALKGYAVGDNGVILGTSNGGDSWSTITSPVIRDFNAITFLNADIGYIVGGSQSGVRTILRTVNGGADWTVLINEAGGKLNDISFADSIQGYAVGDSATVLKTTDAGLTWNAIVIDTSLTGTETFNAVDFYNTDFGAIGGKAGALYVYTNISLPEVQTSGASFELLTQVEIQGSINTHGDLAQYSFCYATDSLFSDPMCTDPQNIVCNSFSSVTASLNNLMGNTTYYYFVTAENVMGAVFGDTLSLTTSNGQFNTTTASNLTGSSAVLNGYLSHIPNSVNLFFEYGLSDQLGNEIQASPSIINDTLWHNISAPIFGLLPDTTYYFRMKGVTPSGILYGMVQSFYTSAAPIISTLPASLITPSAAQLNGKVNSFFSPAIIKFEYGTTTTYGFEVDATPSVTSDTLDVIAYAQINGLSANTTYHFRINSTNSSGTTYGNDKFFYTGNPEIPNFNFEYWDTLSALKLGLWDMAMGNIAQFTPSCSGSFAVNITSDSLYNNLGVILIGSSQNGESFSGGTPFNARPDSLIGCFNYAVADNDTAIIMLLLKKQGVYVSNNMFKISGNSAGSFVDLKFPIQYSAPDIPDTLILGIVSTDFRTMSNVNSESYVIVDDLHFTGTSLTIPNSDFEEWTTQYRFTLNDWFYERKDIPIYSEPETVFSTNDAQNGQYAVKIESKITENDTMSGQINSGQNRNWIPQFPISSRHQSLTGYYKFYPQNNDSMRVVINVFNNGQTVGWGEFKQSETVSDYTPFNVDLTYFNETIVPDSALIYISTYTTNKAHGNSILYMDNLNFDGFLSHVENLDLIHQESGIDFNIYPNPFSEKATITFAIQKEENITLRVFDLSGKQITSLADGRYNAGEYKLGFSASGLSKGFYICVLNTDKIIKSKKIVIY